MCVYRTVADQRPDGTKHVHTDEQVISTLEALAPADATKYVPGCVRPKDGATCKVCHAPLLGKEGVVQMGFSYCSQQCRGRHKGSAEFQEVARRASQLSMLFTGARVKIEGGSARPLQLGGGKRHGRRCIIS